MIHVKVNKSYKSIKENVDFELPDFTVLTGKNGSGKSHLMEVIAKNKTEYRDLSIDGTPTIKVKYIPFNGLNPQITDLGSFEELIHKRKEVWGRISGILQDCKQEIDKGRAHSFDDYLNRYPRAYNSDIKVWYERAGGNPENITESLINRHYQFTEGELFSSQFASIFKLYHINLEDNLFAEYRHARYGDNLPFLSEEDFVREYGPKPWELINDMLRNAHLSYEVNNPIGLRREEDFNLHLTDVNTSVEIKVADLSTGEKVLMSLALAIYNTQEQTARPDVLLLDEPDAALHPEFSKVLLDAIQTSIVGKAKVKVIISTHSPSTVALAPEESIFMMNKSASLPEKITKERAIGILTQDLTNLHISADNRRQVFVESKYDVGYYSRIFKMLNTDFGVTPMFLEPHSHDGTNCTDVINIVNDLRDKGNDLVYGIIDYDNKNTDDGYNYVLGTNHRYAIDNYVFDPIYVAFLLINEKLLSTAALGIGDYKFVSIGSASHDEIQVLIRFIQDELELNTGADVFYQTVGGEVFSVNSDYFTIQGHELEDRIKNKWPQLKAIAKNQDNYLKNHILDRIVDSYPHYLSSDFIDLFRKIK